MSAATAITLTGPTVPAGLVNKPSANFTVAINGTNAGVVVTPTPVAGVVFTPASVNLSTATSSATFTATPSAAGAITVAVTNGGALSNPSSVTYDAVAESASAPTVTFTDSSTHTTDPQGKDLYTFNTSVSVAISASGPEALIYYTTDGSNPDPTKLTGAVGPVTVTVTKPTTLKVVAIEGGYSSAVTAKRFAQAA